MSIEKLFSKTFCDQLTNSLHIDDLFEQIVENNKPAYCMQRSTLLAHALTELGFKVDMHLAKCIAAYESDFKDHEKKYQTKIVDHLVLVVTLEDETKRLIDVGFAARCLEKTIAFKLGKHQKYILAEEDNYVLLMEEDKRGIVENRGLFRLCYIEKEPSSLNTVYNALQVLLESPSEDIRNMLIGAKYLHKKIIGSYCFANGFSLFRSTTLSPCQLSSMDSLDHFKRRVIYIQYDSADATLSYTVRPQKSDKENMNMKSGVITRDDFEKAGMGSDKIAHLYEDLEENSQDYLSILENVKDHIIDVIEKN